jgi:hypothetical protein
VSAADLDARVRAAMAAMRDDHPEGNGHHDVWDTRGVPGWQAAIIRLARPALMLALGLGVMGCGTAIVGVVEAIVPGAGGRMAQAMALLLVAYPKELYWLVAFMFGGQALAGIITAWKGQAR